MNMEIRDLGVYQVFTGGGTGSGFLIADNLLITNHHVVEPYREVAIERRDRTRIVGKVRRVSPKRDLAIIELSEPLDGTPFELAVADTLASKQILHIVGFPIGLPLSITEGVVSNPRQQFAGEWYVQTDAAINPGNSGGPMLDEHKHLVAVTTCKATRADMVGFGVPVADVHDFINAFREQSAEFGVVCPSCDGLLENAERYCDSCGTDLKGLDIGAFFDAAPDHHPVVAFVESGLRHASVNPILARHGEHNWSFHSGSAPIKIWSCCSEHVCFSSPLAKVGKQKLGELFRFLLSAEHAPFSFDLSEDVIRLNLTFHMADVFAHATEAEFSERIASFIEAVDRYDNLLIDSYGCKAAPETELTFLKEPDASANV